MTQTTKSIGRTLTTALGLAVMLAASIGTAQAISRIETTNTDCSAIRSALVSKGAAILRYTSRRGLPIHDRYVSSSLLCKSPSIGVWASVPARDTRSCRVIACDANASDDDDMMRFRPLLRIKP